MLHFELDVLAADLNARTIEGVIVPYGEVGDIKGTKYRFLPGSVRASRSRMPLLVDHDRAQPVGVLAELIEGEAGALGRFTIDATPLGDTALVQAASGSRGSLSIGAEVVAGVENGGVVDVSEALVHETSLLALGAFPSAGVTRVAAESDETKEHDGDTHPDEIAPGDTHPDEIAPEPDSNPEQTELDVEPDPKEGPTMEATAPPVMVVAERNRSPRDLLAGELVSLLVRAQHGDPEARRYMEAALTESISTDVSGLLPPTYEKTVIGGKVVPRPLYETFRGRTLPGVGLAINKPKWTTPPVGAWAADVNADATSSKVVIGSQAASVERWDWAGAIPWVVVQRSDPSVVDEIYSEAVQNFYLSIETRIATMLAVAATNAATSVGSAVAAFFGANKRSPELAIVAPDVWGKLADRGVLQTPVAGSTVDVQTFGLAATWGGIPIVASASLTATFSYLVTRRALDVRITDPVRLTANAIGALNVELAVVGEGLFDTDYAAEVMEFVPTIPAPSLASDEPEGRRGK